MADPDPLAQLKDETFESIRILLETVAGLSQQQVNLLPGGTLPSIAFHVWHSARWVDYDCEVYGGGPQVWLSEDFAERWHLDGIEASDGGTGTGLGDDQAAELRFPGREELLAYASFMHLAHVNRHLGMVEAIKGLQGLQGTATR